MPKATTWSYHPWCEGMTVSNSLIGLHNSRALGRFIGVGYVKNLIYNSFSPFGSCGMPPVVWFKNSVHESMRHSTRGKEGHSTFFHSLFAKSFNFRHISGRLCHGYNMQAHRKIRAFTHQKVNVKAVYKRFPVFVKFSSHKHQTSRSYGYSLPGHDSASQSLLYIFLTQHVSEPIFLLWDYILPWHHPFSMPSILKPCVCT